MRANFKNMDKFLFILMILYTILGLIMIFSASSISAVLYNGVEESYFFKKQLIFVLVTWIAGIFFILHFPTSRYKTLGPIGMICIIGALFLLIPYGSITNSAKSWYDLGFFNLQPSEFAKSVMIVFMAVYYEKIIKNKSYSWNSIMVPVILVLIVAGLVAAQPDFGTAAIIIGIAFLIFLALPINKKSVKLLKYIGVGTGVVVFILIIGCGFWLNNEQSSRLNYKDPCTRYTDKTGYQVCNGFIAISNGGLFGVGLGNSTQKYLYLPEAYTDFIFPVIVEELGAIVGGLIIIFYIVMLYRILKISRNASTLRGSIMTFGTFAFILLHLLINLGGVLALIPLTGVPVPFLSYGGSFYINLMFLMFLTQRVQIETNIDHKKAIIRNL